MMTTRWEPRSRMIVRATSVFPEPDPPAMPMRMRPDIDAGEANRNLTLTPCIGALLRRAQIEWALAAIARWAPASALVTGDPTKKLSRPPQWPARGSEALEFARGTK